MNKSILLMTVLAFLSFMPSLVMAQNDVDTRIPVSQTVNKKTFALIISNENYKHEVAVPFALSDGELFAVYCEKTFGIPKKNIHRVADATLNDMKHELKWLKRVMKAYEGEARAIVYYSGHGMPDEKNQNAIFLPVDGYANDASSGMSSHDFYKELSEMPSQSTIVFIDACFSGSKREGGMILEARGVAVKAKQEEVTGPLVVFSAAQGDETAFPYKEKGHGLFTYFLLEKLQQSGGAINMGDLGDYVTKQVTRNSIIENGKPQTPSIVSPGQGWREWKLVDEAASEYAEYAPKAVKSKMATTAGTAVAATATSAGTNTINSAGTFTVVSQGKKEEATTESASQEREFKIVDGLSNDNLKSVMESRIKEMMEAFNTASAQGKSVKMSKDIITSDALKEIDLIWKTSSMTCPPMNLMSKCLHTRTGYQIRGIPVDLKEADDGEKRQELTVDFTPDGKISNVAIAIEMHRYDMIMAEKSSDIDYARRQVIVDFVENFRTAYNRKDLKLLTSVFSDKALIITGKVISEKPNSDIDRMTLTNNKVVYIKQTKQEYLRNLSNVFKTTKFVNVKFEDIDVVQHPKYDDVYGVTLKQYWHTNRYSDEGYLFLMIDFRDADNPLIQVRTWQPYKNKEGEVITQKDDVYHLGSFRIVR
ncbi:MAG: caspase family protein [Prevotella sp.]|nr:caspase family protein [Prevotella sp.]